MKKLILGVVAMAAFGSGSALAADIPVKAPPPPAVTYDWTGIYTGIDAGWRSNRQHAFWAGSAGPIVNFDHNRDQGIGSSHWGAQWQWNYIVIGVEGSYTFGRTFARGTPNTGCPNVAFSCYTDLEGVWMAGGRVGFVAARNWLLYGTGGWASGNVGTRSQNNATAAVFDDFRVRKDGWFAGGGVEWMVASTPNVGVIVGVEYKHIDLGTVRMLSPGDGGVFGVDTRDVKTTADQVTLRASLKWNSLFGPVTARY